MATALSSLLSSTAGSNSEFLPDGRPIVAAAFMAFRMLGVNAGWFAGRIQERLTVLSDWRHLEAVSMRPTAWSVAAEIVLWPRGLTMATNLTLLSAKEQQNITVDKTTT